MKYYTQSQLKKAEEVLEFYTNNNRIPVCRETRALESLARSFRSGSLDKKVITYLKDSKFPLKYLEKRRTEQIDHVKYIVNYYIEHCKLPTKTIYKPIGKIKEAYRKNTLNKECIDYINNSVMPIDVLDLTYKTHLQHAEYIVKFFIENGNYPSGRVYPPIRTLRHCYKIGKLKEDALNYIINSPMPIKAIEIQDNTEGVGHYRELKRIYKELLELNDISSIMELQEQVNQVYEIKLEELLPV